MTAAVLSASISRHFTTSTLASSISGAKATFPVDFGSKRIEVVQRDAFQNWNAPSRVHRYRLSRGSPTLVFINRSRE